MTQTINRADAGATPAERDTPPIPPDTLGGLPLEPWYGPPEPALDVEHDLGEPGSFPFTRGVHRTMYRDKVWTMRQFAGFGSAEDTNERYRFLLAQGQTGLSVAFDMPTLMGIDSDSPHAHRRGRPLRCCRRLGRGHAHALQRHRRRRGDHVDDDQLPGADPLRDVPRCRGRARHPVPEARRDAAERHPQGVHRSEGVHLPDPAVDAARHRRRRVLHAQRARAGILSPSAGITSAKRAAPPRRSSRSRSPTASHTSRPGSRAASTSTSSRRGSRSSSTRTSTSSRRSRNTAPPGASGRVTCVTDTAPRTSGR